MIGFWKNEAAVAACLAAAPKLLVTLDFDGTLAALAETPDKARLDPAYRAALKALAASPGVSLFILSGRALAGLRRLVGLRGIYYGGNHGSEISGPGFAWQDGGALASRRAVAALAADMRERFPAGTGVLVEDKVFSASVHYRNIRPAYRRAFLARMKALAAGRTPGLKWRRGRKVFEALPAGAPHKGDALVLLSRKLRHDLCIVVGDDLTDEDMFRVVAGKGIAVRVGRKAGSAAPYYLGSQADVLRLLEAIAACRRKEGVS